MWLFVKDTVYRAHMLPGSTIIICGVVVAPLALCVGMWLCTNLGERAKAISLMLAGWIVCTLASVATALLSL